MDFVVNDCFLSLNSLIFEICDSIFPQN